MIRMKLLQRKLKRRHKKKYLRIIISFTFFICCVYTVYTHLLLSKIGLQSSNFTYILPGVFVYTLTLTLTTGTYYYDTRYYYTTYYSSTTTVPVPVILLTTTPPPLTSYSCTCSLVYSTCTINSS